MQGTWKYALPTPDTLVEFAAEHLANPDLPNIEIIEEAKLLEATISDVIKNSPDIYLIDIKYWVMVGDSAGKMGVKVESSDEDMLLPLDRLVRIDFVPPRPFDDRGRSSWVNDQT